MELPVRDGGHGRPARARRRGGRAVEAVRGDAAQRYGVRARVDRDRRSSGAGNRDRGGRNGRRCPRATSTTFSSPGSTATGRKVAMGCAERLIPYSLELGGKDPAIVPRRCRPRPRRQRHHMGWRFQLRAGVCRGRAGVCRGVGVRRIRRQAHRQGGRVATGSGRSPVPVRCRRDGNRSAARPGRPPCRRGGRGRRAGHDRRQADRSRDFLSADGVDPTSTIR